MIEATNKVELHSKVIFLLVFFDFIFCSNLTVLISLYRQSRYIINLVILLRLTN